MFSAALSPADVLVSGERNAPVRLWPARLCLLPVFFFSAIPDVFCFPPLRLTCAFRRLLDALKKKKRGRRDIGAAATDRANSPWKKTRRQHLFQVAVTVIHRRLQMCTRSSFAALGDNAPIIHF